MSWKSTEHYFLLFASWVWLDFMAQNDSVMTYWWKGWTLASARVLWVGAALRVALLWLPFVWKLFWRKAEINNLWKPFYRGGLLLLSKVTLVLLAVSHLFAQSWALLSLHLGWTWAGGGIYLHSLFDPARLNSCLKKYISFVCPQILSFSHL